MARRRKGSNPDQLGLLEARVSTAPLVPAIREKVKAWREGGYKGVSDTTRILLNYWFYTDHRLPNRRKFAYHYFQREAVETLIYLYEIAKVWRHKGLVEAFATRSDLRLLQYDDFARYCVKMATGSGKTKVMSLAIAWQFFNAVAEARDNFARTFLLIAPNVIVFERLRTDFEGGRIFRADPVVPPELEIFWRDFQCYMRGEGERASSLGALYLTNVQQFYERQGDAEDEPEEMTAVLGPKPTQTSGIEDFDKRIIDRGGPVVVLSFGALSVSSSAGVSCASMPSAAKAVLVATRVMRPRSSSCRQTVSSRLARTSLIRPLLSRLLSTLPAALPLSLVVTGKTQRSGRWQAAVRTTSWESDSCGMVSLREQEGRAYRGPATAPSPADRDRTGLLRSAGDVMAYTLCLAAKPS